MTMSLVRLNRRDQGEPWGLRIHGGKDFQGPLVVIKVTTPSIASSAGLSPGDILTKINNMDTSQMTHKQAQDAIRGSGLSVEFGVEKGKMTTWGASPNKEGKFSLKKQYNSPLPLYSEQTIAETLSAQAEVIAGSAIGVNFKKNDKPYNYENSEVYKMMKMVEGEGQDNSHETMVTQPQQQQQQPVTMPMQQQQPTMTTIPLPPLPTTTTPITPVKAPTAPPAGQQGHPGQTQQSLNICADCERLIVGVFVRVKDKVLHVECFKCATCGASLKNVGYFNVAGKLYCDVHAGLVARQQMGGNPGAPVVVDQKPFSYLQQQQLNNSSVFRQQQQVNVSHVTAPKSPLGSGAKVTWPPSEVIAPVTPPVVNKAPQMQFSPGSMNFAQQQQSTFAPTNFAAPTAAPPFTPLFTPQGSMTSQSFSPKTPQGSMNFSQSPLQKQSPRQQPPGNLSKSTNKSTTLTSLVTRGILNNPTSRVAICAACNKQIRGPFISTQQNKLYCPAHFKCFTCARDLMSIGFVDLGNLHCEFCWESKLAPVCGRCGGRVKFECLKAMGKEWHPECFKCGKCGVGIGGRSFFVEEGVAVCEADWNAFYTTKCISCGFPIEAGDRWVEALGQNYHSQCFNCSACKKNLEGQSFFAKAGRPFCKAHSR